MRVLVAIPAFNETQTIARVIEGARQFLPDILVVDDGSVDDTGAVAAAAGATVRRLAANQGKGAALKAGFSYAREHGYDYVVTLDGDGQHDPADIANVLPLLHDFDLILGNRMDDSRPIPWLRLAANRIANLCVSLACWRKIEDSQTGFRAYSVALLRTLRLDGSRYDLETEVIIKAARAGLRIGHCRIRTIYAGEISRFDKIRDSLQFLGVLARTMLRP